VWSNDVAQALQWATGGLERIQKAEVLFAFVREYQSGSDQARLLVAGTKTPETFLRGLRLQAQTAGAPHRSGHHEQPGGEHSDAVQALPPFLAHDGATDWEISGWEDAVPRVENGVPQRVDRLRALGNSVVPAVVEQIGRAILEADRADFPTG
jgi:DNA (cytosine-5)-methyltransferase 1